MAKPSSPVAPARTMTIDEWASLPEDEPGELVDGCIEEEETPDLAHESAVSWLIGVFRAWAIPRGGFVFGSEAKFAVGPQKGRKPDVTVYLPGGPTLPRRGVVRVPPDIAVEVVSPTPRDSRRDRIDKLADYARFGVRYYWLIDPEARTLEILELGSDGRYVHGLGGSEGIVTAVPGCPDLSLDLQALWTEIDRLSPQDKER